MDGEPVGCISAVRYGPGFGFLGFYIVRSERRGRGHGLALWRAAMARLRPGVVGLDGVVAQQDNYRRSGFELQHRNIRYGAAAPRPPAVTTSLPVLPASEVPFADLLASDRHAFPAPREAFLRRWISAPGHVAMALPGPGGLRGHGVLRPCREGSKIGPLVADNPQAARAGSSIELTVDGDADAAAAALAAGAADIAVVVVGSFETEGGDRSSMSLPDEQDALIAAVAAANPRTIVFIHAGSPILMPWVEDVAAIVEGWYPGGEDGETTADHLFGETYPSGKLPITFPVAQSDGLSNTPERYPGVNGTVYYDEELQVGYRWFQSQSITPLFSFGFGLSYTSFSLTGLR